LEKMARSHMRKYLMLGSWNLLEPAHRAHPRHTSTAAALMWGGESPRGREWAHLLAGVAAPSMESSMEAKALGSNMTSAI